ncbi:MAG: ligase-associated DNA damage response endonuclease PdeM [Balneolales bacterium]
MILHKPVSIKGEQLDLLPQKAIYWSRKKTLLLADIHIGKVGTFREAGIAIPIQLADRDLSQLTALLKVLDVERCIILGDLFHSKLNGQWNLFKNWINLYPGITFELVIGNHDILQEEIYIDAGMILHQNFLVEDPFYLVHDPTDFDNKSGKYGLCGHLHPGIKLKGKGRQSITLPCFYFGDHYSILPAFGAFTGFKALKIGELDQVYAIAEDQIFKV